MTACVSALRLAFDSVIISSTLTPFFRPANCFLPAVQVPCQPAGIPPFHYRSPLFPFSATDDDVSRPPIDPAKKKKLSSMPVSQSPWPDAPDAPDVESFPNYFQQPPVPGPRGMNATVSYSNPLYPFMTPEEELASLQEDPVRKMKLASVPVASVPWPDMPPAADPRGSATNAQLTIAQQEIEELRAVSVMSRRMRCLEWR